MTWWRVFCSFGDDQLVRQVELGVKADDPDAVAADLDHLRNLCWTFWAVRPDDLKIHKIVPCDGRTVREPWGRPS